MEITSIGIGTWAIGGHLWAARMTRRASGDSCGGRSRHQLDRHRAHLRIGALETVVEAR
jgi:hypothetical protein